MYQSVKVSKFQSSKASKCQTSKCKAIKMQNYQSAKANVKSIKMSKYQIMERSRGFSSILHVSRLLPILIKAGCFHSSPPNFISMQPAKVSTHYLRIVWRQHRGLGRAWFWGKLGNLLCLLPPLPRDVTVSCARGGISAATHSSVSHQGGRGGF